MPVARWVLAFASLPGCFVASGPVRADDIRDCRRALPEVRIAACTRLIEKAGAKPAERAFAFGHRGRGFLTKVGFERLAVSDFEQARKLVPAASSGAALYKGLIDLAQRQFVSALQNFDEAIRRDPRNADAFLARGVARRQKGDADAALADFDAAIQLEPTFAIALANRGTVLGTKREHERAIGEFDAALRLDPTYANALRYRGYAKSELGRLDEALADYDAAIRLDPQLAAAYNGRGHVFAKSGNRERALADFDTAVRLDPSLIVALMNRAAVGLKQGNRQQAITDYERALTLPATSAEDRGRLQIARERLARLRAEAAKPGAGGASAAKDRRVALVVGNGKYAHVGSLENPRNDAVGMAATLRRLGFTKVIELRDATRVQMATALKDFGDLTDGAEWAVVFFAGHGIEINGTSYLIPVDAALKRDTHVEDEAISLARVMAKVDAASRIGLVILDSCRNNPFAARMVRSAGATRSISSGLAPVEPDGNVLVAYSAKHGTTAADGTGRNSPFTEALLAHIEEPGLEINFLFRKVRDAVRRGTDRRQEPFVYGSLGSDPLFFRSASAR